MSSISSEWEQQKATWLAWPHNRNNWGDQLQNLRSFYIELILMITQYQDVNLLIQPKDEPSYHALIIGKFPQAAYFAVTLIPIYTNTIWIRDYGPYFLKNGDMVEFEFNGWGGKFPPYDLDNLVPNKIYRYFKHLSHPCLLRSFPEIFEGGALELNGQGIGLTTRGCLRNLNRNSSECQLRLIENLKSAFQIQTLLVLPHGLSGDHTDGHVDHFVRFISTHQVLLVMPQDTDDPNYRAMRENKLFLQNELENRVEIIEIPSISGDSHLPLSYANFIFVNGAIILPDYGDEDSLNSMIAILHKNLDHLNVESIRCDLLVQEGGSLHCISKNHS